MWEQELIERRLGLLMGKLLNNLVQSAINAEHLILLGQHLPIVLELFWLTGRFGEQSLLLVQVVCIVVTQVDIERPFVLVQICTNYEVGVEDLDKLFVVYFSQ